jgi:hypothetical protein
MSSFDRSRNPIRKKLFIRLTSELDCGLRRLLRYRGDLSRFIQEALTTTDLHRVALLAPGGTRDIKGTTASTDERTAACLKVAASNRGCSANQLVNSAIAAWLGKR